MSNVKKDLREEILGHSEWAREKCVAAEALNYIEQLEAENKRLRDALEGCQQLEAKVATLEADREKLLQLLESAVEVIGRFVSDEGWAQSDMDKLDNIDAVIASMRRTGQ